MHLLKYKTTFWKLNIFSIYTVEVEVNASAMEILVNDSALYGQWIEVKHLKE